MNTQENDYQVIFSRNLGVLSETDQEKLKKSSIAIAGMGGVGGLLADRLIRLGVNKLKITDPGNFEKSNFNRQLYSSYSTLNRNKAETLFTHIKDINKQAEISWSANGIKNENDTEWFLNDVDLVIDEMDMGLFKESILLQRSARRKGIFYMFSVAYGYGALIVVFDPSGMTLEEYDGLDSEIDINDPQNLKISFEKIMPIIPTYASERDLEFIHKMHIGERPGSATSLGAGLAALLATNEATNIILRKRQIISAPKYIYVDLLEQRFVVREIA
jgi:tRNA threonylcarbamoyladenosine dehydratase